MSDLIRREDAIKAESEDKENDMGVRPMKVDPNVLRGISNMSKQDQERLTQCIFCAKDPRTCNCTEADEDEYGMCLRYERRADGDI